MRMRLMIVAAAVGVLGCVALAVDDVTWTIDSSQSNVTVEVEATLGISMLSDADNTSISGTIQGQIDPFAFPFEQIHITGLNAQTTSNLDFALTVSFFGGVVASTQNLAFGIPGPNSSGVAGGPASVDITGAFSQAGNLVETSGFFNYQGVGILGTSIGSGSVDLSTQPPVDGTFTGTITQSQGLLTLSLPLSFTGTQLVNEIPVTITTTGTLVATAPSDSTGWKNPTSGNWNTPGNWSGGLPGTNEGRRVYLGPVNESTALITGVGGAIDVLRIKSPQIYTLSADTNLTVSDVQIVQGSHHMNGRIVGSGGDGHDVWFDVEAGANFRVSSVEALSGGTLLKTGAGLLVLGAFETSSLQLDAGLLRGAGNAVQIDIADGATLDLVSGSLATSPAELAEVAALVASGYAGGAWTGDGISSSAIAPATGVGYYIEPTAIPTSRLLVRVASYGDTDLSGAVGFSDLLALAQNYQQPGTKYWFQGDFDYNGLVEFADLLRLAQNYSGGSLVDDWAHARGLVPEPTVLAVALAGFVILGRRRVL